MKRLPIVRRAALASIALFLVVGVRSDAVVSLLPSVTADPAPISWDRQGVVLDRGPRGAFDDNHLESPIVVRETDGTYVLFYRGQSTVDAKGRIMRAVSSDGLSWRKTGVVMEPTESYEGDKIDPMAVMLEDGLYRMWYGCAARGGAACYASSPDGIRWTRHRRNPVLGKTPRTWDGRGAGGQHTVIKVGGRYHMLYKGFGADAPDWTFYGLAESKDGIRWKKKGKVVIPEPELGETTVFKNLFAFEADGRYYLAHTMAEQLSLFLWHSEDGREWDRCGLMFSKALAPGGWDVKWATSPILAVEDGRVRMWYEGGGPKGRVRVLYAETSADVLAKACS